MFFRLIGSIESVLRDIVSILNFRTMGFGAQSSVGARDYDIGRYSESMYTKMRNGSQ